jgi:hypothetical protein
MIDTRRIRPETAQALIQGDVVESVKRAMAEVEQVRSVLKTPQFRDRRAIGGAEDAMRTRMKEVKAGIEKSLESFQANASRVIQENHRLKQIWIVLAIALFGVGLFGLVWGVVNDSKLILGGSALFAGTAILWPFNNLRRIRSEEIEIQTAPDRVRAGINACMAKQALDDIAACFDENLKLLDRAFEELRKPTTP